MIPVASIMELSIQKHLSVVPKLAGEAVECGPCHHMVVVGHTAVLGVTTNIHNWKSKTFLDKVTF